MNPVTDDASESFFPIRELVRRTGVNASTLRAWENRHGLLTPRRTESGHRLYGMEDVRRVRRLQELLVQGLSLAEIVPRLEAEGAEPAEATLDAGPLPLPEALPGPGPAWREYLLETLRALEDFSTERLDNLYNEACSLYPIDLVTEKLLMPALDELGRRWEKRPSGVAEEHFFTAWLRNKLGARMHHVAGISWGRPLILACLPGETHEIGLLVFALGALQRGFRVIYLGANMPLRQLVYVAQRTHAAGLVLAGRDTPDSVAVLADLGWLARQTPSPVYVGSHFSLAFREALLAMGVQPLGDNIARGLDRLAMPGAAPPRRGRPPAGG